LANTDRILKLELCKECQPVIPTTSNQALPQYQQCGHKQTMHDMTTLFFWHWSIWCSPYTAG